MLVRLSTAIAAISLLTGAALAQGAAKPTDRPYRLHCGTTRYRSRQASPVEIEQ